MNWWLIGVLVLFCGFQNSKESNLTEFNKLSIPIHFVKYFKEYITNVKHNVSIDCKNGLSHYLDSLTSGKLWALKMFDAGTKIPSGLLRGKIADFGSFDECLGIRNKTLQIKGKYCLGSLTPNSLINIVSRLVTPRIILPDKQMGLIFATCLPDKCSTNDVEMLYSFLGVKFYDNLCQTKTSQPPFEGGDIAVSTFFALIFAIMLLSTAYDAFLSHSKKKPAHKLLLAFSVITNGKNLLKVSHSPDQISCLHGIRVITMMWIIFGHRHMLYFEGINNFVDFKIWIDEGIHMYAMASTMAVDTFLLLSGLVLTYVFISQAAKGTRVNILIFYAHRYLRLTPVVAVVMLVYMTVLVHLGNGPLWKYRMLGFRDTCRTYWWSTLLYVQNYVNTRDVCIPQTWYVSADTQLFLISPLILFPLKKNPYFGLAIASILGIASTISTFIIAYHYKLSGLVIRNLKVMDDFKYKYYFITHTRATPWFLGIILGYLIYKIKSQTSKIVLNKVLVIILWILALGLLYTCGLVGHNTLYKPYDRIANSFFIALGRPGWALGVAMVIVLCILGYGGPVNSFLSITPFQILSKLTYTMYLLHMGMQYLTFFQYRSAPHFSELTILHNYWGDYIFTVSIALIFTLGFESPLVSIEKFILGGSKKPRRDQVINEKAINES